MRAATLAIVLAACTESRSSPPPQPSHVPTNAGSGSAVPRVPIDASPTTADLLAAMAALVGLVPEPAELASWATRIDNGAAPMASYIDQLLASERFATEIVPALVFGAYVSVRNYYALPSAFVLKRGADASTPLYLRDACTASEAVSVRPWWNLDEEVKVCPDAYRPEKWTISAEEHSYKTRAALSCDSQVGSPELETKSLCGCGPNLIRCLRDEDQYNELNRSFMNEVKRTTAYVVEHDLPMKALFTGNQTFRDRNVELYYRRQKIGARQLARADAELRDLATWPKEGKWAPRPELGPGQHAGVLTTPQILHANPDRRQRQRGYYELMWCNLRNSFGATTQKVLEINTTGNNFFVHDSWQKLAHTPLCTDCHARLDYGSQFLFGYPDSRASTHYMPALEQATKTGPLYGRDADDPRGQATLTPASFAKLATEQPEFASCMTEHFVSYVLGDRATPEDIEAIEQAVTTAGTFKQPMKVALERYAARWRGATSTRSRVPGVASGATPVGLAGAVIVSAALRLNLEQHCFDCHDQLRADDPPELPHDFTRGQLPRPLLVRMADQVASGMMPKDQQLDPRTRDEIVGVLIDALWTDQAARDEARRYYLGRARGLPAHQIDQALYAVDRLAQARPDVTWGALERGIWSDQATITPGLVAVTALEAVRACVRANKAETSGELEECIGRATALGTLARWPRP
jgi:hypothetical protein